MSNAGEYTGIVLSVHFRQGTLVPYCNTPSRPLQAPGTARASFVVPGYVSTLKNE